MRKRVKSIHIVVILTALALFLGANTKEITKNDINVINKKAQAPGKLKVDMDFGKIPLYFITNQGQVHKKARFYAKASRYTLWLTKEGLVFDSSKPVQDKKQKLDKKKINHFRPHHETTPKKYLRDVSRLTFLKANKNPQMVPVDVDKLKVNYFIGNDKSKWYGGVPTSKAVLYKKLYKHIDLKVYGIEKEIEYDWIVKPGGNPKDIQFQYKNVKKTRIDKDGNLLITTDFGDLVHQKPIAYQESEKGRIPVQAQFKKIAKNTYGFSVGTYDKTRTLIIDPVVLAYSTYLGGMYSEWGHSIAADDNGNVYVTGTTSSPNFPTLNGYQNSAPFNSNAFITRIDTNQGGANSLVYSSYLGGMSGEGGEDIAIDQNGHTYIIGTTDSLDFPTKNPFQSENFAFSTSAFISRLDTNQVGEASLIYSTYFGGDGSDVGQAIAVDNNGHVYFTGYTTSPDLPILNQLQSKSPNLIADAFFTRLNTNISGSEGLVYSTYLGGGYNEIGCGVAIEDNGIAYLTGRTESDDFPITQNAFMENIAGQYDVFVTKIDTGKIGPESLLYSTFLGGNLDEFVYGIALDESSNVYITGMTWSTDFPLRNQIQECQNNNDAFITKIDTNQIGNEGLIYSTALGGSGEDEGKGIALDNQGYVYVTGYTNSQDFPTLNAYQYHLNEEAMHNAFVAKIDTSIAGPEAIIYSTYLGGSIHEQGYDVAVDSSGNTYVTGYTASDDFPLVNHYQERQQYSDVFVSRFKTFPGPYPLLRKTEITGVSSTSATASTTVRDFGNGEITARGVCWDKKPYPLLDFADFTNDGTGSGVYSSSLTGLTPGTTYYVKAYAINSAGIIHGDEVSFTTLPPTITVTSPNGGEQWPAGSLQEITWTGDGIDEPVEIKFSTDNGGTWLTIVQATENDGSYHWTLPITASANSLIRISNKDEDGGLYDVSDAVFAITSGTAASLTLRTPNGGESWQSGSRQEISWTSTGTIDRVALDYSTDKGKTWKSISKSTGNDGSYLLIVPYEISDSCLVQITGVDTQSDTNPTDTSDEVFSITGTGNSTPEITSPNGGEVITVGTVFNITWKPGDARSKVSLAYSLDNGQSWEEIAGNLENNGSYLWTVPDNPSSHCLMQIKEDNESAESDDYFSIVPANQGEIVVTSPNGGERWTVGSQQQITWIATGIDMINLAYSTDWGVTWREITAITSNDGSYDWTIPDTVSENCLVRVSAADSDIEPLPYDVSDYAFAIVRPQDPTIRVTAPNGGEELAISSLYSITWQVSDSREKVDITYSLNGGETWSDIVLGTENNGQHTWTVPNTPSEACLVRISESDGSPLDISDQVFTILAPPQEPMLTVIAPNGGESFTEGSIQDIKWTSSGDINTVSLQFSTDKGISWKTITQSTENDGIYSWTVPHRVSNNCLMRVTAADNDIEPTPSDKSNGIFSIIPPTDGDLRLTSPNGDEVWQVGSQHNITWTGSGDIATVTLDWSADDGKTWSSIIASTANSGSYQWTLPYTESDHCRVRITALDGNDPRATDMSNKEFAIVAPTDPTIRVLSPNGGESLEAGSLFPIKWYSNNSREKVTIAYSTNGGDSWSAIASGIDNSGNYDWQIPNEPSTACLMRVSQDNGEALDISDGVFTILPPPVPGITLLTPNGGENLEAGSEFAITWEVIAINKLLIQYSTNNGATWLTIATVSGDISSYTWTVPGKSSTQCLVRISGLDNDDSPWDQSDAPFAINTAQAPTIIVLSPNGGESWQAGSQQQITWTSSGIDQVLLEYSLDGRSSWKTIETISAGSSQFTWTLPDEPSPTCLIRISEALTGATTDTSNSFFTITPANPPQTTPKKDKNKSNTTKNHKK